MPVAIQTVLGKINPKNLGKTLTHEHFSLIFDVAYTPPSASQEFKSTQPINLKNLGWIRQNPYSHKDNIRMCDNETWFAVEEEVKQFKQNGGGCIVENTTHGITRNTELLYNISKNTGVHIVAGTGYYVDPSQSDSSRKYKIEEMADVMRKELTEGCIDFPAVKCGIIGEVGCSWPLTDFEKRSIRATALVQEELKCPVIFHPGRNELAPREIIKLYQEAGGDVSKAVMSHLDRTLLSTEELQEFAAMGCYCEFDLFGIETSHYQLNDKIDMPSDAQRIQRISDLIRFGYGDKILISHDIHTKHRLEMYGGHGFNHILENVIPKMKSRGISETQIEKILVQNPATWLQF